MSERELFEYLKKYWSDLEMSKDQYSKHDCFSKSTNTRIELKCRKKHYNTLMLEKSKYEYLILKYYLDQEIPLYINYTPKSIYCFDLRNLEPVWIIDKRMPKSTDFENKKKVKKEYCLISIHNSKII